VRSRVESLVDWLAVRDLGLTRLQAGLRILLCVPAGMAAGYGVGMALGLPALVGLLIGALPAFLTCFVIVDDSARWVAARTGATIVPFAVALFISLVLHPFRLVELVLIVVLLFVQFYAARFGSWAGDAGNMAFTAYLCGLLLPLPLTSFEGLALVAAASLASAIVLRTLILRPHPLGSLRLTRRAIRVRGRRVLEAAVDVLVERTPRLRRRLDRRRRDLQQAALVADGLLGKADRDVEHDATAVHEVLFDTQVATDGLGRLAGEVADAGSAVSVRQRLAAALQQVIEHGGLRGEDAARQLVSGDRSAQDRALVRGALLLSDLAGASRRGEDLARRMDSGALDVPFETTVVLAGNSVSGTEPVLKDVLDSAGLRGPWRRLHVSAPLRTAIQAAVAVAAIEPLSLLLDSSRFYWAVIGVLVIMANTNTMRERLSKLAQRAVGTVIGGAVGILLVDVLGTGHPFASMAIVVVVLAVGIYSFSIRYAIWTAALVIALCQVYAFSGQFTDLLIPIRLAENLLGGLAAVVAGLLILPVATRAMIRAGIRRELEAIRALVDATTLRAKDRVPRLRAAARTVNQSYLQLEAVMKPLVWLPSAGRSLRDETTLTSLRAVSRFASELAARADGTRAPKEAAEIIARIDQTMGASLDALTAVIETRGDTRSWVSIRTLIDEVERLLGTGTGHLGVRHRAHLLARIDDALTALAGAYGMRIEGAVVDDDAEPKTSVLAFDWLRRRSAER
jgi:hypothetical protein